MALSTPVFVAGVVRHTYFFLVCVSIVLLVRVGVVASDVVYSSLYVETVFQC